MAARERFYRTLPHRLEEFLFFIRDEDVTPCLQDSSLKSKKDMRDVLRRHYRSKLRVEPEFELNKQKNFNDWFMFHGCLQHMRAWVTLEGVRADEKTTVDGGHARQQTDIRERVRAKYGEDFVRFILTP